MSKYAFAVFLPSTLRRREKGLTRISQQHLFLHRFAFFEGAAQFFALFFRLWSALFTFSTSRLVFPHQTITNLSSIASSVPANTSSITTMCQFIATSSATQSLYLGILDYV